MNTYLIPDEYGFWDLSGRNLFFKFPKFSFVETSSEIKLDTDYITINDLSVADPLAEALKAQGKMLYIKTNDRDIDEQLNKIIRILPLYLLHNGKYVDGAVKLFDEIIFGVKSNPKLHMKELLKKLKSDRSLSKFSHTRPTETLD